MPAILDPEFHEKWLNADMQDPIELQVIINNDLIHNMKYCPVSKLVNSVKNNDPKCIKPVDENL
jgi:putative SOS response-associated peptidase YedK